MSDNNKVLVNQIGTPLVWVKNSNGDVIRDINDRPISSYIVDFKYSYDEENDDEANIKFEFGNPRDLDNSIFNQDFIIKLQWGYLVTGGAVIKSPERTVAVRDIRTRYNDKTISVELECTDLISYIKNIKTNTVNSESDYFIDWLKEVAAGKFKATFTTEGFKTLIDKQGTMKNFEFDKKNNVVIQRAVDNARFETHKKNISFNRVIKGKSLAINNAIDAMTKNLPDGPYIQDSTDDQLDIRPRNFNQPIFKRYTFGGLTGELLEFEAKTDTKKVKEDKKYAVSVDPKKKQIKETEIDTADTQISKNLGDNNNYLSNKPNKAEIDEWLKQARATYEFDIQNPEKQKDIPDITYKRTVLKVDSYMGNVTTYGEPRTYTLPAREVLNDPDIARDIASNRLANQAIENLQKKYSAEVKVIGDPSLIKAKIYLFSNLSKKDTGEWYSVRVDHVIDKGGYMCEMNMVKKPSTIYLSNNSNIGQVGDNRDELDITNDTNNSEQSVYPTEELDKNNRNQLDNDDSYDLNNIRPSDISQTPGDINTMVDRVNQLNAENDLPWDILKSGNKSDNNFDIKVKYPESGGDFNIKDFNKPNADGF